LTWLINPGRQSERSAEAVKALRKNDGDIVRSLRRCYWRTAAAEGTRESGLAMMKVHNVTFDLTTQS
jgi:hypothetical protein